MPTEIWIGSLQHQATDDAGGVRRLSPAEVHERALERRAGWLAWELDRTDGEARIAAAIEADPDLAAALAPRALDAGRYSIVLDDALRARLRAAIAGA